MPAQLEATPPRIESTYKAREVEGVLDLRFYRPIGFWLAQRFARLRMTPTAVTLLGGFFGLIAGHLYYYSDLRVNLIGMALHVFANALDNADGQLARLTNQQSRRGRIIDSVVDHIIFTNIYVHLALRYLVAGASPAILLLALAAGLSHALQGAAADFYRNAYIYFVNGRERASFDSSTLIGFKYGQLSWRRNPVRKLFLGLYLIFTQQQESFSPNLKRLHRAVEQKFSGRIPMWLKEDYRARAQPAFKWWGLLMTNSRMLILLVLLVARQPIWFFWIELTALNLLLFYLLLRQERMASALNAIRVRPALTQVGR
jgi:CDP-alcohol phosphatidyltransferase